MNALKDILDFINRQETPITGLFFTSRTKSGYTTYAPNVKPNVKDHLIDLLKETITVRMNQEELQFNPSSYITDTVMTCNIEYVNSYGLVMESFKNPDNVDTSIRPQDLTFYCLEIKYSGTNEFCRLYRRVTKFKKLSSKGILAFFSGDMLTSLEQDILGIDGFVDVIEFGGKFYILNHIALERIFGLEDKFSDNATKALSLLKEKDVISNFDQFYDDCMNDKRCNKILSKLYEEEKIITSLDKNFENVAKVIELFELEVQVTNDDAPKVIYEGKEQIMDILRIISDAYYRSILGENLGVDNAK